MTAITVYDGESCSTPAATLTFTRELTCTPQTNNSDSYSSASYASDSNAIGSACEYNGVVSTLTDCTYYYYGWDTSGSIPRAFGYYGGRPYLIVEEYDPSARCGDDSGVLNVTAYLLDEKCHVNRDGTASSRITLGRSLRIAEYSDPNCENLESQAEVPYGNFYDRECVNNATRYLYNGNTPPMSAVAVYEDSSCSQTPIKVSVMQGFVCEAERDPSSQNCRPDGNSYYSASSCTSDYKELATNVFSDGTVYVMVEEFLSDICDNNADAVTIYVMDDACHTNSDDATSFRATLASDGSATISTYDDPNCQQISSFTDFTKRAQMCLPQRDCADGYIRCCAKRFSLGDSSIADGRTVMLGGRMTSVAVYDGGSCQAPAASLIFTRELTCTRQANSSNSYSSASYTSDSNTVSSSCEYNGVVNTVTDCTNYYSGGDTSGSFRDAFGNYGDHSYLIVEEYDSSARYCGDDNGVLNVTAYIVDETCHTNRDGTASTKITLGRSLTIAQYSDPICERMESEAEVPFGDYYDRACLNNATRYLYNGPTPPMSAVAVYKDSSCSRAPVKLTVTQGFVCDAERGPWIGGCRPDGNSHYSVSSCTSDYNELAAAVFGDETPYVVVEEYLRDYCAGGKASSATVYIMDNACHTNTDDATSFRATLTSDGSAIITTYSDANCELVEHSTDFSKRSGMCLPQRDCPDGYIHGCAKRFTVGGLKGMTSLGLMTAIAIYERSCAEVPLQVMAFPDSTCEATAVDIQGFNDWSDHWFYYNCNCITDSTAFTESKFGDAPYLLMEKYAEGTNCGAHVYTAAYRSDNMCHPSILEGAHFRVSLGDDNSLTLATFPSGLCRESDSGTTIVTVGSAYINTGACYNGTARFYANLAAFSVPVPSLDEYKTREQIMFPDWLWDPRPRRIFESD